MKNKRLKSNQETPEKSEIFKMFEKIKSKNAENGPEIVHAPGIPNPSENSVKTCSEKHIFGSPVRISKKVKNSPKITTRNYSKFEAIRSIFENPKKQAQPENVRNVSQRISSTNLKDLSSMDFSMKTPDLDPNISTNLSSIGLDRKKSNCRPKSDLILGKKSDQLSPILTALSRQDSNLIASNSCVVRLPNLGKKSPQSDTKKRLTSKRMGRNGSKEVEDEQSQFMPIRKFLEKKNPLLLQQIIDGESNPNLDASKTTKWLGNPTTPR